MAASKYFDQSFDQRSLESLFRLEKALDQFPNRVAKAIEKSLDKTEGEVRRKLVQNYRNPEFANDKVIGIEKKSFGNRAKFKIEVKKANPSRRAKQGTLDKARFDANIKLRGRKRYVARRKDKPYDLRSWSGPKDASYKITVPAKQANPAFGRFLRYKTRQMLSENLREAIAAQGIGPRGGVSRIRGGDVTR